MAVYRSLQISIWQDSFILKCTPEEKFFYSYLLTNSKTSQCGCYELPMQVITLETGYNTDTVNKLLDRFTESGKIEYDNETSEILIKNWHKYHYSESPKVVRCIKKEYVSIKNVEFRKFLETLFIQYGYSIDTEPNRDKEKEKQQQKEKEKEEEKQQQEQKEDSPDNQPENIEEAELSEPVEKFSDDVVVVFKEYEKAGFGTLSAVNAESLEELTNEYSKEWLLQAFKQAAERGRYTISYLRGILQNWKRDGGITTDTKKSGLTPVASAIQQFVGDDDD